MLKNIIVFILVLSIGFILGYKFQRVIRDENAAYQNQGTSTVFPGNTEVAQYYFDNNSHLNFSFYNGWEVVDERHLPGNTADTTDLLIQGPFAYTGGGYLERYPSRVIIQVSTSSNDKDALSLEKNIPDSIGSVVDPSPIMLGNVSGFKYDFYDPNSKAHRIEIIAKKANLLYEISYYGPANSDPKYFQNNPILEKQAMDLINSIEVK